MINGSSDVLPETRAVVEAAIEELGYRPSAIARSMARGLTHTLAIISPNLTDYTFASVVEGAELEARQHNYFVLSSSASDPQAFHELVDELVGHRRVDGLIVINPYADERYMHVPNNFPVVFVGARSHDEEVCSISLDDEKAAYEATRHLTSLGHQRIAVVTGPMAEDCSQDRLGEGTRLIQRERVAVRGFLKVLEPVMERLLARQLLKRLEAIKAILDSGWAAEKVETRVMLEQK